MAVKVYNLDHKEMVEVLIKHLNLHDGIWQLNLEFGIAATNVQTGEDQVFPAALVPVNRIGLAQVEKESPIALNATVVNPEKSPEPKAKPRK